MSGQSTSGSDSDSSRDGLERWSEDSNTDSGCNKKGAAAYKTTSCRCAAQVFLLIFFFGAEYFLLTIMCYDRYVSICKPLHYGTLVLYSVVPPVLNPLIYSLRNQELKPIAVGVET
ncbi:olfactory receptor 4E2-like [Melospiza melodia melodia]|uniref:olfactory receptor 4E2-like n=1 Tax=Melospiza melodia melodia TaxID=1914991 RepID=UPI002FD031B1